LATSSKQPAERWCAKLTLTCIARSSRTANTVLSDWVTWSSHYGASFLLLLPLFARLRGIGVLRTSPQRSSRNFGTTWGYLVRADDPYWPPSWSIHAKTSAPTRARAGSCVEIARGRPRGRTLGAALGGQGSGLGYQNGRTTKQSAYHVLAASIVKVAAMSRWANLSPAGASMADQAPIAPSHP
jgi:hypothetical protein